MESWRRDGVNVASMSLFFLSKILHVAFVYQVHDSLFGQLAGRTNHLSFWGFVLAKFVERSNKSCWGIHSIEHLIDA